MYKWEVLSLLNKVISKLALILMLDRSTSVNLMLIALPFHLDNWFKDYKLVLFWE